MKLDRITGYRDHGWNFTSILSNNIGSQYKSFFNIENMMNLTQQHAKSETPSRCAVMVLGMHRSGTSALAGLLTRLGGDGPINALGASPNNPLGYFEVKNLFHLQEELLASAGTSWDDYSPFPASWMTSLKAREFGDRLKDLLLSEFENSSFFVIKDPRNCRLLPFWQNVLADMQIKPLFVHTHRNPAEVAQSLHKRNGFDPQYGYLLWLRHILDAEAESRGYMRSFTSYDRILQSWPTEIEKIAADLNISWPKYSGSQLSEIGAMIRPDLRHNVSDGIIHSKVFSTWFREASEVFSRWAEHGENESDYSLLGEIRHEFNKSAVAYAGTVYANGRKQAHEQNAALKLLKSEHARAIEELKNNRDILGQSQAALTKTGEALHAANARLAEEQTQRADLASDASLAQSYIKTLQTQTQTLQSQITTLQTARAKHDEIVQKLSIRVRQSDKRIQALKASRSWRMTAPIRRIMKIFR